MLPAEGNSFSLVWHFPLLLQPDFPPLSFWHLILHKNSNDSHFPGHGLRFPASWVSAHTLLPRISSFPPTFTSSSSVKTSTLLGLPSLPLSPTQPSLLASLDGSISTMTFLGAGLPLSSPLSGTIISCLTNYHGCFGPAALDLAHTTVTIAIF